jgi:hypothetical protein
MSLINLIPDEIIAVNILLGGSWIVFFLLARICTYLNLTPHKNTLLSIARIAFVFILISPVLTALIPNSDSLEIMPVLNYQPVAVSNWIDFSTPTPTYEIVVKEKSETYFQYFNYQNATIAFILLLFILKVSWTIKSITNLSNIIQQGHQWKKNGRLRIILSDSIQIPFSTRVFGKSDIIIPTKLLFNLTDLKIILKHEGRHHRNGDTTWMLFLELVKLIFFYNPFFYLWLQLFENLQELACDEAILKKGKTSAYDYGNCLIRIVRSSPQPMLKFVSIVSMAPPILLFPNKKESHLKRRIQMFRMVNKDRFHKTKGLFFIITLFLLTFSMTLIVNGQKNIHTSNKTGVVTFHLKEKKAADIVFIRPMEGTISSKFGLRVDPFTKESDTHTGVDIVNKMHTPILAAADGIIVTSIQDQSLGKFLVIDHGGGFVTIYLRLASMTVKAGQIVKQGELIGRMGNTGRSTGPHLHFAILFQDKWVNPEDYWNPKRSNSLTQVKNEKLIVKVTKTTTNSSKNDLFMDLEIESDTKRTKALNGFINIVLVNDDVSPPQYKSVTGGKLSEYGYPLNYTFGRYFDFGKHLKSHLRSFGPVSISNPNEFYTDALIMISSTRGTFLVNQTITLDRKIFKAK